MQNAITSLLDSLATQLGPLSPFTKAIVPAILAVAVAVVNSIFAGAVDSTSITIAVSGLVLALVVFLVPNKAKVPTVPAAVAAVTPTVAAPSPTSPAKS